MRYLIMVYLLKSNNYYKIGFTSKSIEKRMQMYSTHNPNCYLLQTINTYKKTKHKLESALRAELKKSGCTFCKNWKEHSTEWFIPTPELAAELDTKGLKVFKSCRNRLIADYNCFKICG
jgi:hypothetical protein